MTEILAQVISNAPSVLAEGPPTPPDIQDIISSLFPSIYIIVATIGAFIVTMIILTYFFYKPVKKMMKNRHDFIQGNIDDSVKAKKESLEEQIKLKEEIKQTKLLSEEMFYKSKKESETLKLHYINEGKKEAERLIEEASNEIHFKLAKIEETRKDDIVDAAIMIAKKLIAKDISKNKMEEYLDSYIKGE